MTAPDSYGKFAHIDAVALRLSRLDASGVSVVGATGALVFCCEGRMSTTPTVTNGSTIDKGGFCAGKTCNTWETPDRISGFAGELEVCNTSDELLELIGVATGLSASVTNHGSAAVQIVGSLFYETGSCSDAVTANGCTVEMWSRPVLCKTQVTNGAGVTMWRKKVVPWAYNFVQTDKQDPTGDAFPSYTFSFKLRPPGAGWADGPFGDNGLLDHGTNTNAPTIQGWTFAEYWSPVVPPTCPAGTEFYTAVA